MTTRVRPCLDMATLMEWRREVITAVFGISPSDELVAANEEYYLRHLPRGTHLAFIASDSDADIGCGAICLADELPSPDNPTGKCAYLMNIYIRPAHRHCGHGGRLVAELVATARRLGCGKIYLEATPQAVSLYDSCGFRPMQNMMKYEQPATTQNQ